MYILCKFGVSRALFAAVMINSCNEQGRLPCLRWIEFVGIKFPAASSTLASQGPQVVRWVYEERQSSSLSQPVHIVKVLNRNNTTF